MESRSHWRQLKPFTKKYDLRLEGKTIGNEKQAWLMRGEAPEGFELELPPSFQAFTSTVDGKRLKLSGPLPGGGLVPDDLWKRQERAEEKIDQRFGDDAVMVREWKTSVEVEMERLQLTLDEHWQNACAVMNAWLFLVLESLPEADIPEKGSLQEYENHRLTWDHQKSDILTSLSKKYSPLQVLQYESTFLWEQVIMYGTTRDLCTGFSALCKFFGMEPLIRETTLDGLLYYRKKIAEQVEALLPLELDRIACEIRHTEIVRKGVIVTKPHEKDWTEEEWAAAAEAAFSGAPKRRADCQRVVKGFHDTCEAGRPPSGMNNLWSEAGLRPGKIEKAVRDAFERAGISAGDGYEEADPASLVTALQMLLSHYEAER